VTNVTFKAAMTGFRLKHFNISVYWNF